MASHRSLEKSSLKMDRGHLFFEAIQNSTQKLSYGNPFLTIKTIPTFFGLQLEPARDSHSQFPHFRNEAWRLNSQIRMTIANPEGSQNLVRYPGENLGLATRTTSKPNKTPEYPAKFCRLFGACFRFNSLAARLGSVLRIQFNVIDRQIAGPMGR